MKNGKQISTKQRMLRIVGWMLVGAIIGGVIGFLVGYYDWKGFSLSDLLPSLLWGTRTLLVGMIGLVAFFIFEARKTHSHYQLADEGDDELVDSLYPKMFRYLEYATIAFNIATSLVLFNLLLGMGMMITSQRLLFTIPGLDILLFIILSILQALLMKTTQRIRDYQLSAFPTVKEMKDFVNSLDEGEKQANFEQSFIVVFNLNQRVLPTLYIVVFFIQLLTQTNQMVAYGVILTVHVFINLMQYDMVRRYFK